MKLITLLLFIVILTSSCFARGGISGEVAVTIDTDIMSLHKAVVETLREEKIQIKKDSADTMSSLVEGKYADETSVTIHSRMLTSKVSSMTIQIGIFGDELRSAALLEEIGKRLPRDAQPQTVKPKTSDSTQP